MSQSPEVQPDHDAVDTERPTSAPRLRVSLLDWHAAGAPVAPPIEAVPMGHVAGDVRVLQAFPSAHLHHPRDIWVYLPPGYEADTASRYPVLYMHDGNNLFDPQAAFGHRDWGVSQTAEWMIQAGLLPPVIIVGVANTPDRIHEYTWHPCPQQGGGRGQAYARFMTGELKPFIDATYRTRCEREQTGVMGSSLGGLISLYLGLYGSDVFGLVGAMSPSIWWADRQVLADMAHAGDNLRIWLDMGSAEGHSPEESARYVEDARALKALLADRGYELGRNLAHWEVDGANHSETAWGSRMSMALLFLFGDQRAA